MKAYDLSYSFASSWRVLKHAHAIACISMRSLADLKVTTVFRKIKTLPTFPVFPQGYQGAR